MNKYLKQCVCCGAPLTKNHCEYCGAVYKENDEKGYSIVLDNNKGILKYNGIEFEVIMTSFECSTEVANYYVDSEIYYQSIDDNVFTFELEGRKKRK